MATLACEAGIPEKQASVMGEGEVPAPAPMYLKVFPRPVKDA